MHGKLGTWHQFSSLQGSPCPFHPAQAYLITPCSWEVRPGKGVTGPRSHVGAGG